MSVSLRITIIVACLLLALYVIRLVLTDKLQLRYSLLWLALVVTLLICSFSLSRYVGFLPFLALLRPLILFSSLVLFS